MAFAKERARFGITMFPTDYSIQPIELARAVEERGFDALFFPEHTHIPRAAKRRSRAAATCRNSTGIPTIRSLRSARAPR